MKWITQCHHINLARTFDTALKEVYDTRSLCIASGTNNGERLAEWIDASPAKTLVIVTDVDEYHGAFREYLDNNGAVIHGIGVKPLYHSDLKASYSKIKSYCK